MTVARLEQQIPDDVGGSTFDVVAAGLGEAGSLLSRYHAAGHRVATDASEQALRELDRLHHALDAANAWEMHTRVDTVLSHLGLDPELPFANASGGRKRQTLLWRLLLDEVVESLAPQQPAEAADALKRHVVESTQQPADFVSAELDRVFSLGALVPEPAPGGVVYRWAEGLQAPA